MRTVGPTTGPGPRPGSTVVRPFHMRKATYFDGQDCMQAGCKDPHVSVFEIGTFRVRLCEDHLLDLKGEIEDYLSRAKAEEQHRHDKSHRRGGS